MLPVKNQNCFTTPHLSVRHPLSSSEAPLYQTLLVKCARKVAQSDYDTYSLLKSIAHDDGTNAFKSFKAVLAAVGIAIMTLMTPKFGKELETDADVANIPLSFAILAVGVGCLVGSSKPSSKPSTKTNPLTGDAPSGSSIRQDQLVIKKERGHPATIDTNAAQDLEHQNAANYPLKGALAKATGKMADAHVVTKSNEYVPLFYSRMLATQETSDISSLKDTDTESHDESVGNNSLHKSTTADLEVDTESQYGFVLNNPLHKSTIDDPEVDE